MNKLDQALGIDPSDPAVRRAEVLYNEDADMLEQLVQIRKDKGLTQQQVADAMGVTQPTVAAFEGYDHDPKLSTIQRYANAVEALIEHAVHDDADGQYSRGWKRQGSFAIPDMEKTGERRVQLKLASTATSEKRTDFSLAA
ncbi:helix-turn-helix domain-containing protein [Kocuria sp. HSID16901]|uniref:helix-turn-helix domain-containing protein n=1 Tax=Kocuria sp. HSID16901 TaxID=2419505 RepID=UPI00069D16EB|nr:helix-turn-helix transcriptional regulator [Kocuria sp. HSID16901]